MRFEMNADASPEVQAALDVIQERRGAVPPMFRVLANSPDLALRIEELSTALWNCGLSQITLESLFLLVARRFRCEEQWRRHEKRALEVGVSQDSIEAIGRGLLPSDLVEQKISCSVGSRLLKGQRISDRVWDDARRELGVANLANICAFMALASLVAMTINLQEVE